MPEAEFATLNPAFIRPVAASGTGYFLVPYEKAETFRANLDLYRSLNGPMVSWQTVNAKRGESIDAIAKRHGVTGSYLRATNGALKEKKGKLTLAATIMVPMSGEAKVISETLAQKTALKAAQPVPSPATQVITPVGSDAVTLPPPTPAVVAVAVVNKADATLAPPDAHRVQRGETLFSISKKYGIAIEEIKSVNAMKTNSVKLGQTILLRADANAKANATVAAAPSKAPQLVRVSTSVKPVRRKPSTYTVRSGDTLHAIAVKHAVELDDLMRWNRLSAKSVLQPGNKIRVTL